MVLESTTYPGTTEEVVKPILERRGLAAGTDFFLAYSPEREDPGNAAFGTADDPARSSAATAPDALALAGRSTRSSSIETVPVSSPAVAEAVKLTENIFRAVNIALVNELKVVYDAHGHRRLGGDRGGQDQAVRLHAVLSRARASAATASRSTPSI